MQRLRAALIPSIVILAGLVVIAMIGMWTGIHNLAPRASLFDLLGAAERRNDSVAWKVQHDQPITLLLLARGGAGKDNANFTDTIMLVTLQPRSRRALVISLPRFAWVTIPALRSGDVSGKLYSAYALGIVQDSPSLRREWQSPTGAGDLTGATVSQMTGLPVDYWVVIDSDGFRRIIDAMGGVRVKVSIALDDPRYPVDDTGGDVQHVHIAAGDQLLDGKHALEYARSRLSTSEADRSRRQQQVLLATLSRLDSLSGSPALIPLVGALQGHLLTNLRFSDVRQFARLAAHVDAGKIRRVIVDESNFMVAQPEPAGDQILIPRSGDYRALREFLAASIRETG